MLDTAAARILMVDRQLRTSDVTNLDLLDAFAAVRREDFVLPAYRALAYTDAELPLTEAAPRRVMPTPAALARLIQLAGIRAGEKVLTIGCGSGYAAAILRALGANVSALESDDGLLAQARERLAGVTVAAGPLAQGLPSGAPYDVILLEGAVDEVPKALTDQLAEQGRLVAAVGHGMTARATLLVRTGDDIGARQGFDVSMPGLPGFERASRFEFAL